MQDEMQAACGISVRAEAKGRCTHITADMYLYACMTSIIWRNLLLRLKWQHLRLSPLRGLWFHQLMFACSLPGPAFKKNDLVDHNETWSHFCQKSK